jgi:hypothetical protein
MPKRPSSEVELTNAEIMSIVREMRMCEQSPKDRARIFRRKYPEFAERYDSLFEMACAATFDIVCLQSMLALRERIHTKQMSVDDASAVVGQGLFNKYVAPAIDPKNKQ